MQFKMTETSRPVDERGDNILDSESKAVCSLELFQVGRTKKPHCGARIAHVSRRVCVRSYVHFVRMCVCVCVRTCIYDDIYACVCVFVHLCVYTHVYVYVYAYLCIDCGSWYQCFSVWTVSCMRMCFRVHMYAYAYVCGYIYMCIFLQ